MSHGIAYFFLWDLKNGAILSRLKKTLISTYDYKTRKKWTL